MSDQKAAPSGLWGWVASATEVVKKQSDVIYNIYKEDLKEFSQTVIKDTTAVVQEQISTLSGVTAEQKPKPKLGSGGTRHQNKLSALQRDESTYTTPVISENADPAERASYEEWHKNFDLTKETEAITHLLTTDPQVREIHGRLVPAVVSYRDFWERYSFRHHKLLAEEQRRAALLLQATDNDEEEIGWDVEDESKQSESPAPKALAAAHTTVATLPTETETEPIATHTTTTTSDQPSEQEQAPPSPTKPQPQTPTKTPEPTHSKPEEIATPNPASQTLVTPPSNDAAAAAAQTSSPITPKEPATPPSTPVRASQPAADGIVFEVVPSASTENQPKSVPTTTPISSPPAAASPSTNKAANVQARPAPSADEEQDDLDAEIAAKAQELTTKDSGDLDDEAGWDKWE